MRIKKGDTVVVISGKDKGKKGKVLEAYPKKNKVLVEGVSVVNKNQKPNKLNPQGGIIQKEMPIDVSNVMYYDAKLGKGTKIAYKILEDGKKVRIAKKSNQEI